MKFLTLLRFKPGVPPDPKMILMINEGAKAWIKANLASGVLECAYNVLPSSQGYYGMGITNAASHEEAFKQLTTYPAFAITDFELYAIGDVIQAIDDVSAAVKAMTGG
jgi:hypothetical protein